MQIEDVKWYQVALTVGTQPGRFDVRGRVQAKTPDAALRAVMRTNGVSFAHDASIWLLGRRGAPTTRVNVRCRLPVVRSV
jgi:hypothetical protein